MGIKNVCILGATGSIGLNTLDVISQHPEHYRPFALTANTNHVDMLLLCEKYRPQFAVMVDERAAELLASKLKQKAGGVTVLAGAKALEELASHDDVDIVMAAIVGAAGLKPNLAAASKGKKVLLANKESLVMSGQLFMSCVKDSSAELLPIDSEHNAIFQCLPQGYTCGDTTGASVSRILLTASGGPFRTLPIDELRKVTPAQACAHPNWVMGQKISVDSASLMNKGLELIEACWLFNVPPSSIDVHIHPESIIHSMVEYIDGSVLAQMGNPDMRTPIAYGLAWPERISAGVSSLDLFKVGQLNFEHPDMTRFPCLQLAKEAFNVGGTACASLNAANEVAVASFLKGNIPFTAIPDIIRRVLETVSVNDVDSVERVLSADLDARRKAEEIILSI
ncbi:MAG: 1-deoxy-D-xylulose-5-phosphate reductoisomerase [Pseudohongiellaceae bacterium]